MTASSPMEKLGQALRQNMLVRIIEQFGEKHPDSHLKDLVIDEVGPGRRDRGRRPPRDQFRLGQFPGLGPGPAGCRRRCGAA